MPKQEVEELEEELSDLLSENGQSHTSVTPDRQHADENPSKAGSLFCQVSEILSYLQ